MEAIDIYAKSHELLEVLANSIHDRDPKCLTPFCFNVSEIHAAERWLRGFVEELKVDCICV